MILCLDTSSLVKLYIDESGSDEVQTMVAAADLVGTSLVAHARRFREKAYSSEDYRRLVSTFDSQPRNASIREGFTPHPRG